MTSRAESDLLIEHLHKLQDRFGHLSAAHLAALADEMKLAQAEVFEVATFYHHFDVVKEGDAVPPAITVRVCDGLSCEMAGAQDLLARLPASARARRARSRGTLHRPLRAGAGGGRRPVPGRSGRAARPSRRPSRRSRRATSRAGFVDLAEYRSGGGYTLLRQCIGGELDVDDVIKTLEASGLRGLGGAGFPAGRKWRIVRSEPAPRLMAVNIDEGEPGTFKDRVYLERDPHRFIEGMLIAAWAVGISQIYVYLRDEYHGCSALLEAELAKLRAAPPYPGMPDIVLRRGAGAYICGEESAMIESIEGKRGMPRLRPPYVAQVGLFGRPTLEHNFETLYWVRDLLEKGAEWFASHGRNGRKGLRSFSVSGRVRDPGVKLAPAGITLQELIDEHCGGMLPGHTLYGYLPGGASGGILPRVARQRPARLRHAAAVRLLHRLGRGDGALRPRHRRRRGAQHDALLRARVVRPMHAVPQRHREGVEADGTADVGPGAARRPVSGHARCFDLRPRPGRAEPDRLRRQVLSPRAGPGHECDHPHRTRPARRSGRALRAQRPRRAGAAPTGR